MKTVSKFLAVILLLTAVFSFSTAAQAKDIVPGSALEKEMNEMIKRGILTGYPDGTYKPTEKVTREQFAAFISRALELPAGTHTFTDVPATSKLSNEIGAVYSSGLMQGNNDKVFQPKKEITREQVAQTLKNVLVFYDMDLIEKRAEFSDADKFVSSGGIRAVFNMLHYDITHGIPDGKGGLKYSPDESTSREQAAAFILRILTAKEKTDLPPVTPEKPAEDSLYYLGYVVDGDLVKQQYGHEDYLDAANSFKNVASAKAIYKGNEIIRIKNGIAFGDRVVNGVRQVTTVYYDTAFKHQATYVEHGRELRYIDANADFVKVQVGGTIGYVKQSEVDFVPSEMITDRDYYLKNQFGTLMHHQYNYVTNTRANHSIGPAPSEMATNVRYYSKDGVNFSNAAGVAQFKHYPYFQYQSVRTKTNYTAEELDKFVMDRLKALNNTSSTYTNAVTRSKMIGLGQHFIELQDKYNVNALFMLAAAMHESANGMSNNALTKNNLFGIRVYDGSPHEGTIYAKPENSIDAFAREYMNRNYVDPFGAYANGAVPGNKTTGINVSYASDPTWGAKVAGHMFRADLALGQKDINKYQLGISNTPSTNIRTAPQGELLYQFKRENLGLDNTLGYPVVIAGEQKHSDGYIWYKVHTDLNPGDDKNDGFGWIRSDLIDKIN